MTGGFVHAEHSRWLRKRKVMRITWAQYIKAFIVNDIARKGGGYCVQKGSRLWKKNRYFNSAVT